MRHLARGAALLAILLTAVGAGAQEERSQTDPTRTWWYYGVSESDLNQLLSANNARLVSLKVQQTSPTLFTVSMVANQGPYFKIWYWYYGLTVDGLAATISSLNARIIDLEVYEVGGEQRVAAILVDNTGAENKAWWWYVNVTAADASNSLAQNNARLVDISTYVLNGERRYSVVMIENTGADQKGWWWYVNASPDDVNADLQTNNARLIALEDEFNGRYAVIMESCPCPFWWFYYDRTSFEVDALLAQNGARLVSIEPYFTGFPIFQLRFNVVMINNANAETSRIGELLRSTTSAPTGLYLKQIGGPVLAALQERYIFEPASTIKALIHLRALLDVQADTRQLTDEVTHYVFTNPNTSCPSDANAEAQGTEPLSTALKEMMRRSDNPRTRTALETVGVQAVNELAQALGMTHTHIDQTLLGCGVPPFNQLTLTDIGLLYERVADGTLLSGDARDKFYYLMAGTEMLAEEGYDFPQLWPKITEIVDQEAPPALSASDKQAFLALVRENTKAGGYSCTGDCLYYTSIAGWAQIPFCVGTTPVPQQYVFGLFVDGAASQAEVDAGYNVRGELLRNPIQSALTNWASCVATPTPVPCLGDCSGDGKVTINELVTLVQIALGFGVTSDCVAGDSDGDQVIGINELVGAVARDLNGC